MKIYIRDIKTVGHIVYAPTLAGIQAAENQRMNRWNATRGEYEHYEIDPRFVYECSPELAELLSSQGYWEPDVQHALYSLFIESGVCSARVMSAPAVAAVEANWNYDEYDLS